MSHPSSKSPGLLPLLIGDEGGAAGSGGAGACAVRRVRALRCGAGRVPPTRRRVSRHGPGRIVRGERVPRGPLHDSRPRGVRRRSYCHRNDVPLACGRADGLRAALGVGVTRGKWRGRLREFPRVPRLRLSRHLARGGDRRTRAAISDRVDCVAPSDRVARKGRVVARSTRVVHIVARPPVSGERAVARRVRGNARRRIDHRNRGDDDRLCAGRCGIHGNGSCRIARAQPATGAADRTRPGRVWRGGVLLRCTPGGRCVARRTGPRRPASRWRLPESPVSAPRSSFTPRSATTTGGT